MRLVAIMLLLSVPLLAISQRKGSIDSLKKLIETYPQKDSSRLALLIELAWILRNSNLNEAFHYSKESVELASKLRQEPLLAKINNQRGILFRNIGDYPEAEKRFYEALKIAQKYGNLQEEAYAYNNLGDLQKIIGTPQEGIKFMQRANKIFRELKDERGEAYTYIRMSETYQKLGDHEKSYEFAEKSLNIRKKLGNEQDIGASLNRIGDLLTVQEKYEEAIGYYQQAISFAINSNDATGKVSALQDIAKIYISTQKFKEAKDILDESIEIVKKNKNREQESNIYELYTELYEKQKNVPLAYEYYKKRQIIRDSIFSNQRMLQISQMRVRYDLETTEKENSLLKEKLSKEAMLRGMGIAFSLVVLFFGLWVYKSSRHIRKYNAELAKRNEEIRTALENIEETSKALLLKNEEIEVRNQEIETKNEHLIESIGYALIIQQSILPSTETLQALLKDYFIIWEPKDIISGDFYWIADKPDKIILAVADCTGHGVPGAMMSMLGNNLLNSIIHDKEIYQPDTILAMMHKEIIDILHKDQTQISDSMEVAIVVIEKNKTRLHYAGAGIALYYFADGDLQNIQPDKTSIGNTITAKQDFTLHTLDFETSTQFYLSTDGYKDQFGGEENKKFGSKQFKSMLKETASRPTQEQKEILTRRLYLWQKAAQEMQTDDITVLSFKLG